MRRELWDLAWQGLKARRRSTALLFLVLLLSLALAVITMSVAGSIAETNEVYRLDTYGEWRLSLMSGRDSDRAALEGEDWSSWVYIRGSGGATGSMEEVKSPGMEGLERLAAARGYGTVTTRYGDFGVGSVDEEFLSLGRIRLKAGRLPEAVSQWETAWEELGEHAANVRVQMGEIAMETGFLNALGYTDAAVGDVIHLPIDIHSTPYDVETVHLYRGYVLTGILEEYTSQWNLTENVRGNLLNAAIIPEAEGEDLRAEATAALAPRRAAYEGKRQDAKDQGMDPILVAHYAQMAQLRAADANVMYFFTVPEDKVNQALSWGYNYLDATRKGGHGDRKIGVNNAAAAARQEADINYAYTVLVFGVTLLAVLCIYAIQLRSQVRQITLFRSIGITKKQLRTMLLYETVMVCLPAFLLGAGAGALGTWGLLKLVLYSGSAPIRLVIPYERLGWLALVWLAGVLAARLALFQIALGAPLTGRMGMAQDKARLSRLAQQGAVGALSALLCAAVCFTWLSAVETAGQLEEELSTPAYRLEAGHSYCMKVTYDKEWLLDNGEDPDNSVRRVDMSQYKGSKRYELLELLESPVTTTRFFNMTEDTLAELRQVPGVTGAEAYGIIDAALMEDGMEGSDLYAAADQADRTENMCIWKGERSKGRSAFLHGRAIQLYVLPEGQWETYFTENDVDLEAFRAGETVVMAFPVDAAGQYVLDVPVVTDEERGEYYMEQQSYADPGVAEGDTVTLRLYDNTKTHWIRSHPLNTVTVEVGHIFTHPAGTPLKGPAAVERPYTILCSQGFVEKAMNAMPFGYAIDNYFTGDIPDLNRGFGYANVYTDLNALYLGADAAVTRISNDGWLDMKNDLAARTAAGQSLLQRLILILAAGGCVVLVLVLIMGNTLVLEAQREQRKYGILQSLGMSRRQLFVSTAGGALLRGAAASALGWGLYLVYAALGREVPAPGPESGWITLAGIALVSGVFLLSRIGLFRAGLMEKLRDEG